MAVHRLALHVAQTVAVVTGGTGGLVAGLAAGPGTGLIVGLALAVGVGAVTYTVVVRQVAGRLELARQTLRQARKGRFDALSALPGPTDRDEIDAMIEQVGRAGRALQREIERLEQVESYRREFLGDVSHELRTPIFAVTGFAEMLLDGALDDDRVRRRFVQKILTNATRLDTLTNDLVEISKLETGQLQIEIEAFNLSSLVREVVDALEMFAREREITLAARVSTEWVRGDRERIRQVLTNLAQNAIAYNQPGGQVEITARRRDDEVRISVVDDGIGIPPGALGRLTERFFRVDKSRSRDGGGTGLGLAIVKHLLDAHDRRLEVESRVGYGSTFAFSLPLAVEPDAIVPRYDEPARPDAS